MPSTSDNVRLSFKGTYDFGMDDKRRVQIPAKWRPAEGVTFSVLLWRAANQPNRCLMVLPPETARRMDDKLAAMSFGDPNAEALRRLLGADGDDLTLDSAGRICLPEKLATKANLGKKVVLVGMVDCFQIWSDEYYEGTRNSDEVARPAAMTMI